MTPSTAEVAVCCASASDRSRVRACASLNNLRVLDGDDRLIGEGPHQSNLLLGERPDLPTPYGDYPQELGLSQQRYRQDCAVPAPVAVPMWRTRPSAQIRARPASRPRVWYGARTPPSRRSLRPRPQPRPLVRFGICRRDVVMGSPNQELAVVAPEGRQLALAQPRRGGKDGLEDVLQVARRAADDAQHVGGRVLLRPRLGQLARQLCGIPPPFPLPLRGRAREAAGLLAGARAERGLGSALFERPRVGRFALLRAIGHLSTADEPAYPTVRLTISRPAGV